jgi:hypothetical protein
MNFILEFHDSQVSKVQAGAEGLHIAFSSAYAHRSGDTPGDVISGYVRPVEMLLSASVWNGPLEECIGKLSGGALCLDGQPLPRVPLPYENSGQIALELIFANGSALTAMAQSVVVRFSGEAHFVESFFC